MAQSFSLAYYRITLNVRNSKDLMDLSDFYKGQDYLDVINEIVLGWKYEAKAPKIKMDEDNEKVFRIKKDDKGNDILYRRGRFLEGIIESGDYGLEEPVVNITTGESTHTKNKNESLLKPFYFLFYVPKNSVYGFLILERIGTLGIYTIIKNALSNYFKGIDDLNLSLKVLPLTSKEANKKYRQLINYEARKVVLHKVRKEGVNISKMTDNAIDDKCVGYTDIVYHAPIGQTIKISSWIAKLKKDDNGLLGVETTGKFSDVDFFVDINGKTKRLSFNGMDNLGTIFDITDDVSKYIEKGYPTFKSLHNEAMDVISDLNKQFGINQ